MNTHTVRELEEKIKQLQKEKADLKNKIKGNLTANKSQKAEEMLLNGIIETVQDGVSLLDKNLKIIRTNDTMKKWYADNLPLEGKSCYKAYHNAKKPCHPCPTIRCLKSGKTEKEVVPGLPGSSIEWIELFSYPVFDDKSGSITGVVEFVRDITARVNAEKKLKDSEKKYRSLFETTGTAMCTFDDDGYITMCNSKFEILCACKHQDIIEHRKKWSVFVHPDDLKVMLEYHKQRSQGVADTPTEYEFRFVDKKQNIKHVHLNITVIPETKERIAALTDISKLKNTEKALRDSEENLAVTLQSIGDAVIATDVDGMVTQMNKAAEKLTGWKISDAAKKPLSDVFNIINAHTRQPVDNPVDKVIREGITIGLANHTILISKDKTERQIADSGAPILDRDGNIIGAVLVFRDVTEDYRIREALKESESLYRTLASNIPDSCIFLVNKDYRLLKAEGPEIKTIQSNPNDWVGKKIDETIEQAIVNIVHSGLTSALKNEPAKTEFEFKAKWFEIHTVPVHNEKNEIVAGLALLINITERKEAEERWKFALEGAESGIWDWNAETNEVFFSPQWKKMLGYEIDEIQHRYEEWEKRIHPDDKDETLALLQDHLTGKTTIYRSEHRLLCKNGEYKWILDQGKIMKRSKDGEPLRLIGMHSDITKLKEAKELLYESEKKYRELTELLPQTLFETDLNGRFTYTNEFGYKLTGYTRDDLNNGLNIQDLVVAEDHLKLRHYVEEIYNSPQKDPSPHEYTLLAKNVNTIPVMIYSKAILKNNKPAGLRGIVVDITEQKKMLDELIKAKEKAEDSDRLKSAFLANVSHEIRTPMNGILGFSELLREDDMERDRKNKYIDIINVNGTQLLNILDDVIDISKIEANQINIEYRPCNINSLLDELYTSYQTKVYNREDLNFKITKGLDNEQSIVFTDETRLRQILANLLNNSFKFTETGIIEAGYSIEHKTTLKFYVKDTGIGISESHQSFIFDQFRQADESHSRKYGGTGLGLSLAKKLVNLMGGDIWVVSKKNKGAAFYFVLPFHKAIETGKPINEVMLNPASLRWEHKKILVVEDDISSFLFIEEILLPTKINLIHAQDGIRAVEMFKANPDIDMVLMDIRLPRLDGYHALNEIRKLNKSIPVIAQTAYAMKDDKERCLEAGFNDYLPKPLNRNRVYAVIGSCLGGK
jgi:PAS domain S-box-containing protein